MVVPMMPPTLKVPLVWKARLPLAFSVTGPARLNVVPPPVEAFMIMVPVRTPPGDPLTFALLEAEKVPELRDEKVLGGALATMEKLAVKVAG